MNNAIIAGLLAAAIRVATPLALAALGEAVSESAGIINLGIEGAMLAGALGAAIGAVAWGTTAGLALGVVAGIAITAIFAVMVIRMRADQIISGTAVTLGAVGLTGILAQRLLNPTDIVPVLPVIRVPVVARLPWLGPALFQQSALTYAWFATIPFVWWWLWRTRRGRELRACGEAIDVAHAVGVKVPRRQWEAVLFGGAMAGLAGAALVLAQVGSFAERMTAGRGFIAIVLVTVGRRRPLLVSLAAVLFGLTTALQYIANVRTSAMPYQLLQAVPYLLALVVISVATNDREGKRKNRTVAAETSNQSS